MNILKIKNLSLKYDKTLILDGINFNVKKGDYINIIGPNGAGKTTLLKVINNLISNFNGSIFLEDKNLKDYSRKELSRKISYIPQFSSLKFLKKVTVFEYMLTGRFPYINKFSGYTIEDKQFVYDIMKKLKIEKFKSRFLSTLSGGELQKIIIGTALVQKADIILLDEAVSFLDVNHRLEILSLLQKLVNQGETIISVTHNMNDIVSENSKILAIKDSHQIYFGELKEFIKSNFIEKIFDVKFESYISKQTKKKYYLPVGVTNEI